MRKRKDENKTITENKAASKCIYPNCEMVKMKDAQIKALEAKLHEMQDNAASQEEKIEALQGAVRKRNAMLFGNSSEKMKYMNPDENHQQDQPKQSHESPATPEDEKVITLKKSKGKRGGKVGHKGYGRKIPEDLPIVEEIHEIPQGECCCPICGEQYRDTGLTEDSFQIDYEFKVILKQHKRKVYSRKCQCPENCESMVVAPKEQGVIYKSLYSTGLWCMLLHMKYYVQIPLFRQNSIWDIMGLQFSMSTIMDGFQKLYVYLLPLYNHLKQSCREESHWHADETRWKIFVDKQDKKNHNWWIWVFASAKTHVYVLDATRSSVVPDQFYGKDANGIINVDRCPSYNILGDRMLISYCWLHVRRDFTDIAIAYPSQQEWSLSWVEEIHALIHANNERIKFPEGSHAFVTEHQNLLSKLDAISAKRDADLTSGKMNKRQQTALNSMAKRWDGLTVFLNNPKVPMQNNVAERALRGLAVGRNNYYGSHSVWSGHLAAVCMTVFTTARMHKISPYEYMKFYFNKCAENGSPPDNIADLLPWNLSEEVKSKLRPTANTDVNPT
jgi:transposase